MPRSPTDHEYEEEELDTLESEELEADFVPIDMGEAGVQQPFEIDPYQYDSLQAQEAFDRALAAAQSGDEERAVQEFLRASKIAETAHEWHLAGVACEHVGDFLMRPPAPYDVERAFRMYRRAIAAFENCGLFAEARDLAYRQMLAKMQRGRELGLPWFARAELYLYWLVAGFGYRPMRVIGTAVMGVLLYGIAYWLTAGVFVHGHPGHVNLATAIYFSGISFSTVGYGDMAPAPHTRFLALTEGFLGAFTVGLFVAVLANRLSKS